MIDKWIEKMAERYDKIDKNVNDNMKREILYKNATTPLHYFKEEQGWKDQVEKQQKDTGQGKGKDDGQVQKASEVDDTEENPFCWYDYGYEVDDTEEPKLTDKQKSYLKDLVGSDAEGISLFEKECKDRGIKLRGKAENTMDQLTKSQASNIIEVFEEMRNNE